MRPKKGNRRAGAAQATTKDRYVGRAEMRERYPVSDMTIWRWMRDPKISFPAPIKLGKNGRNYWWLPDLDAWDASREGGEAA